MGEVRGNSALWLISQLCYYINHKHENDRLVVYESIHTNKNEMLFVGNLI